GTSRSARNPSPAPAPAASGRRSRRAWWNGPRRRSALPAAQRLFREALLGRDCGLRRLEDVLRERRDHLRPVEEPLLLIGRQPVLDVLVLEDLVEGSSAVVLAYDVPRDVLFGGVSLEQEREKVLEPRHETRLYPRCARSSDVARSARPEGAVREYGPGEPGAASGVRPRRRPATPAGSRGRPTGQREAGCASADPASAQRGGARMRRSSRDGRYAERTLVGVDDVGQEEWIVIWIERR